MSCGYVHKLVCAKRRDNIFGLVLPPCKHALQISRNFFSSKTFQKMHRLFIFLLCRQRRFLSSRCLVGGLQVGDAKKSTPFLLITSAQTWQNTVWVLRILNETFWLSSRTRREAHQRPSSIITRQIKKVTLPVW